MIDHVEGEEKAIRASIVIPVYNAEKYIMECLKSIQRQSCEDFEVICVDDGSTDGSFAIVKEMGKLDPRIRGVQQDNGGASVARNVGFDLSTAEFVTFVDADDEVAPNFLQVLVGAIEAEQTDVALGNTHIIRVDGKRQAKYPQQNKNAVVRGSDYEKYKLLSRNAPHAKLFRRKFLMDHGIRFHEGITYEDYLHWIECISKDPSICLSSDFVYIYKRNPFSVSSGSRALSPFNVNSRLVQTDLSLKVSAASSIKGLEDKTFRMQFRARLMRHILALGRSKNRDAVEKAFNQLREGLEPHQDQLRKKLRGYVSLVYEVLIHGTLDELVKLIAWGDGKEPMSLYIDGKAATPKVYASPEEFPSFSDKPKEFFDVSDKARKR